LSGLVPRFGLIGGGSGSGGFGGFESFGVFLAIALVLEGKCSKSVHGMNFFLSGDRHEILKSHFEQRRQVSLSGTPFIKYICDLRRRPS
jgi:hypothetical protein